MQGNTGKVIVGKRLVVNAKPAPEAGRLAVSPALEADGRDEQTVNQVVLVVPATVPPLAAAPPGK